MMLQYTHTIPLYTHTHHQFIALFNHFWLVVVSWGLPGLSSAQWEYIIPPTGPGSALRSMHLLEEQHSQSDAQITSTCPLQRGSSVPAPLPLGPRGGPRPSGLVCFL